MGAGTHENIRTELPGTYAGDLSRKGLSEQSLTSPTSEIPHYPHIGDSSLLIHLRRAFWDDRWDLQENQEGLVTCALGFLRTTCIVVPHVRQIHDWDCGLAAVLMVLRAAEIADVELHALKAACKTESIWTVDLAHLLRRYNLQVTMTTEYAGVNPCFEKMSFYKKNLKTDKERVTRLFKSAGKQGINIQRRRVLIGELKARVLLGDALVIMLVDKPLLGYYTSHHCESGYSGHYVVIYGFDQSSDEFLLHDPAVSMPNHTMLRVESANLDAARCAVGTDHDILFVKSASSAFSLHWITPSHEDLTYVCR